MMSSIFSTFEAMGAESYGWKLVNFTPQKVSSKSSPPTTAAAAITTPTTSSSVAENMSSNSSPAKKETDDLMKNKKMITKNLKKTPRFAVEFDGVHCFETIVLH
ncbi:hypothetical protein SOVF_177860 [Spinacia oleracea]|nr:hypothetical protein SOVF_177860 [Spinacia oleracea]